MTEKKTSERKDTDSAVHIDVPTRGKFVVMDCIVCGLPFGIPESYYNTAIKEFGETFYCPRGHSLVDREGEKKKLDRDRQTRLIKQKEEEAKQLEIQKKKEEEKKLNETIARRERKLKEVKGVQRGLIYRFFHYRLF